MDIVLVGPTGTVRLRNSLIEKPLHIDAEHIAEGQQFYVTITSPYNPQTDGIVEWFNETLMGMLRKTIQD